MTTKNSTNGLTKAEEAADKFFNCASSSSPPPYQTSLYSSKFAVISLNMSDRVRLIQFPPADIARIRELIRLAWPGGIQNSRTYNVAHELKLKGHPWSSNDSGKVKSRRFMRMLLQGLYEMGWVHDAAVMMGRKPYQKDTFVFRKHDTLLSTTDFFTISFDGLDEVTVHEAPPELTQQLIQRFKQAGWSKESAFIEERMEIRLKETYWAANGQDNVVVRLMLLAIVETLEQFDFRIYASLRAIDSAGGEPDSLICCRKAMTRDDSVVRDDVDGPGLVDV